MPSTCRIAIVRPPISVLHKFSKPVECLALGYVGAAARLAGHEVILFDGMLYDWSDAVTAKAILDVSPDIVGITNVLNHWPDNLTNILRALREGGFAGPIILGGHAISFFPDRVLAQVDEVDAVVVGEGERPIVEIANAVAMGMDWRNVRGVCVRDGETIRTNPVDRNGDLTALSWPIRDLTSEVIRMDGLAAISTSRGCYARCSFCSIPRFYGLDQGKVLASGGWLARNVEDVVAEIAALHERTSLLELLIVDDEFFGGCEAGIARALDFAAALRAARLPVEYAMSCRAENVEPRVFERLMEGGVRHVFIGLESGSERTLKLYGKQHTVDQNRRAVQTVKSLGLSFQPGFMLFNPRSTLDQILHDLEFLDEIGERKPVTINSAVDPHFGAPLTLTMQRDGVLSERGMTLSAGYLDSRVGVAKQIAGQMAFAFQPYMEFIAGVRSSVTYEWRRPVPGRTRDSETLLDSFEKLACDRFAGVVTESVINLRRAGAEVEAVQAEAASELRRVSDDLRLARAVVVQHLRQREGGLRYWKQSDLIDARQTQSMREVRP